VVWCDAVFASLRLLPQQQQQPPPKLLISKSNRIMDETYRHQSHARSLSCVLTEKRGTTATTKIREKTKLNKYGILPFAFFVF
jgi:hypothetical protein